MHAGLKALIQKERDDVGTNPGLDYWGWNWVIVLHCVNHLLELGLKDMKEADAHVKQFDKQLKKKIAVYYYSSSVEAGREETAALLDEKK